MSDSKVNTFSLLLVIGAIVGLISIFLEWDSLFNKTGLDFINDGLGHGLDSISAFLAVITSIFALICGLLTIFSKKKIQGIVGAIFGFLILLAGLLFIVDLLASTNTVFSHLGIGVYVLLIAGALTVIGGLGFNATCKTS